MELIREETRSDWVAIRTVNATSFKSDAEARLVDALREHGRLSLSIVAVEDEVVVGHIAFSPITITRPDASVLPGIGLGPMAVTRSRQGCGIGTRLVRRGLERLRVAGHPLCVVIGHPEFYPRFGFERASQFGIYWERKAPDEHFFVLELIRDALRDASGVVRYSPEFAIV